MTKPARGRPPASPERREAIMEAALHCFVDRGFHGTAMPDIAKRASIASGTIYHYFVSKEALVNALYRKWKGEVSNYVLARFPAGAPVREQFSTMFREMLAFAMAHPEAFAFIEFHNHASYLDAESLAIDRSLKEFAAAMIMPAQVQGQLKAASPVLLMELAFGAFNGLMRTYWEKRIDLTPEVIDQAERACWDAVAVHADAR